MGPSITGTGVDVGLGSSEGVAVCVTVGIGTVEVGGNAAGVCESLEKGEDIPVSYGVARTIPVVKETVREGITISVSAEGCGLFAVTSVQAPEGKPASANKLIAITARLNFCLPMSLWVLTVYK
jgi:hypothetical protein